MSRVGLVALLSLVCAAYAAEASAALVALPEQPAGLPWPRADWPVGPVPAQTDAAALQAAMKDAFEQGIPALGETRQVVIIQGGRLVYERYAPEFGRDMRLISWSMAKSVTQALVGAAVLQGLVDIDQPMGNPLWAPDDPRARIPWRNWLQMTDGLRYFEIGAPMERSDAARKLFGPGRLNVARYCAGLPLIHAPGTVWNYDSCGFVLLSDALTRAVVPHPASPEARRDAMLKWMRASLFDVLGMEVQPEFDAKGLYYGSSMIYGTARDFARLGLLYLRDGVWDGRRVLPEGWVDFARTPAAGANEDIYGAGWWLNPQQGRGRPLPVLIETGRERDAFRAQGFLGQVIMDIPSKDLVVVRLGLTPDADRGWAAVGDWLGRVARAFPEVPHDPVTASAGAEARRSANVR
jgi:CubicO group peptidase (beta-lactamase class C family)